MATTTSTTSQNLGAAFAGESQANRRYLFFAQKAEEDGIKGVAKLFRAAADAETVHARNHLTAMGGLKSTKENVEAAVSGEYYEFTKMYPEFVKQAEADKDGKARTSFDWANKVERIHYKLFQSALESMQRGSGAPAEPIFVCQRCGNTVEGAAPDRCPICGSPKSMFKQID